MPRVRVLLAVLLAVAVVGCGGGGKVKVTGKVLKGGKPLPATSDSILVTLVPADSSVKGVTNFPTYADKSSGEFVAADVPSGKYKITVAWNEPTPQDDKLDGKFNVDNTKIVRQVDGKTPLVIDLDKPEG